MTDSINVSAVFPQGGAESPQKGGSDNGVSPDLFQKILGAATKTAAAETPDAPFNGEIPNVPTADETITKLKTLDGLAPQIAAFQMSNPAKVPVQNLAKKTGQGQEKSFADLSASSQEPSPDDADAQDKDQAMDDALFNGTGNAAMPAPNGLVQTPMSLTGAMTVQTALTGSHPPVADGADMAASSDGKTGITALTALSTAPESFLQPQMPGLVTKAQGLGAQAAAGEVNPQSMAGLGDATDAKLSADAANPAGLKEQLIQGGAATAAQQPNLVSRNVVVSGNSPGSKVPPETAGLTESAPSPSGAVIASDAKDLSGLEIHTNIVRSSGMKVKPNQVSLSGMDLQSNSKQPAGLEDAPRTITASGLELQPDLISLSGMELDPNSKTISGMDLRPGMITASGMTIQAKTIDLSGLELQPGTVTDSGIRVQADTVSLSGVKVQPNMISGSGLELQPGTVSAGGIKIQADTLSLSGIQAQPNSKTVSGLDLKPGVSSAPGIQVQPKIFDGPGVGLQPDPQFGGMSLQSGMNIGQEIQVQLVESRTVNGQSQASPQGFPELTAQPGSVLQSGAPIQTAGLSEIPEANVAAINSRQDLTIQTGTVAETGVQIGSSVPQPLGMQGSPSDKKLSGWKTRTGTISPAGWQVESAGTGVAGTNMSQTFAAVQAETANPVVRPFPDPFNVASREIQIRTGDYADISGGSSLTGAVLQQDLIGTAGVDLIPGLKNLTGAKNSMNLRNQATFQNLVTEGVSQGETGSGSAFATGTTFSGQSNAAFSGLKINMPLKDMLAFKGDAVSGQTTVTTSLNNTGFPVADLTKQAATIAAGGAASRFFPTTGSGSETAPLQNDFRSNLGQVSVSTATNPDKSVTGPEFPTVPVVLNPKMAPQAEGINPMSPHPGTRVELAARPGNRENLKVEVQPQMTGVASGAGTETKTAESAPAAAMTASPHTLQPQAADAGNQTTASRTEKGHLTSPAELYPQILDKAKVMVMNGQHEMEVSLKPDHLGRIQLKVTMDNQQVTAKFVAESQQVKEIIENHLPALRQQLQDTGLKVDVLTVSTGSQNGAGQFQQNGNPSSGNPQTGMPRRPFIPEDALAQETRPAPTYGGRGLNTVVDFVA